MREAVAPPAGAWIETTYQRNLQLDGEVAPPAGAWIETQEVEAAVRQIIESLPLRERGLKHIARPRWWVWYASLPLRERGLKQTENI